MNMNMEFSEEQKRALREFTAACNALKARVTALSAEAETKLGRLEDRQRRDRKVMWIIITSFALKLIITGLLVVGFFALDRNSDRIQQITSNQGEQLCALYTVFVNADTPQAEKIAEKTGANMEARREAFDAIRQSYVKLDCQPELTPEGKLPKR